MRQTQKHHTDFDSLRPNQKHYSDGACKVNAPTRKASGTSKNNNSSGTGDNWPTLPAVQPITITQVT